ncbi:hypothetical protein C2W62_44430 [Candidatus Entotheonella serta]|nr:hypothetical protein C2W62_44430 [Candidatus Entotheonella serta]
MVRPLAAAPQKVHAWQTGLGGGVVDGFQHRQAATHVPDEAREEVTRRWPNGQAVCDDHMARSLLVSLTQRQ